MVKLTDSSRHHWTQPTSRFKSFIQKWALGHHMLNIAEHIILHFFVHFIIFIVHVRYISCFGFCSIQTFWKSKIQKVDNEFHSKVWESLWHTSFWYRRIEIMRIVWNLLIMDYFSSATKPKLSCTDESKIIWSNSWSIILSRDKEGG